jgi:glucokinase
VTLVLAVDVGGTNIKAALINENLQIIDSTTVPTPSPESTGNAVADAVAKIVKNYQENNEISAIGFAVPGALNEAVGISRWSGNMNWKDVPIVQLIKDRVGLPVGFKHDVRAGAIAEMRHGSLKEVQNGIFLPIGTGIAAAFILDGAIRAADGFAGEVGHINVGSKFLCVCGKVGCLEATSSTLAISKNYESKTGVAKTSREIVDVLINDQAAAETWNDAIAGLVNGITYMITMLAPQVITIGGGLGDVGKPLFDAISKGLESTLTFQRRPEIRPAHFGISAGTIGCALVAMDLL